jgi:ectoine hydroxylase-related dioxygenase (phytanoyl-CoA dioxygenase family)
MRLNGSTAHG